MMAIMLRAIAIAVAFVLYGCVLSDSEPITPDRSLVVGDWYVYCSPCDGSDKQFYDINTADRIYRFYDSVTVSMCSRVASSYECILTNYSVDGDSLFIRWHMEPPYKLEVSRALMAWKSSDGKDVKLKRVMVMPEWML